MAKDPAFLFYPSDFLTGTYTMTDEQVGKYIRLLCLQHQIGSLTEKHMLNICKSYDEDIYNKFTTENGKYYNARLREETKKRKAYSESRSNNRKSKKTKNISLSYDTTYVQHMENINVNENKDLNTSNEKIFLPDVSTFPNYSLEYVNNIASQIGISKDVSESFFHYYNSTGFYRNKQPIIDIRSALLSWNISGKQKGIIQDKPKLEQSSL